MVCSLASTGPAMPSSARRSASTGSAADSRRWARSTRCRSSSARARMSGTAIGRAAVVAMTTVVAVCAADAGTAGAGCAWPARMHASNRQAARAKRLSTPSYRRPGPAMARELGGGATGRRKGDITVSDFHASLPAAGKNNDCEGRVGTTVQLQRSMAQAIARGHRPPQGRARCGAPPYSMKEAGPAAPAAPAAPASAKAASLGRPAPCMQPPTSSRTSAWVARVGPNRVR